MPRFQPKRIDNSEKLELLDELWSLVSLLETKEEIENFFRDLLSETEAVMLARRIRIARLLLEGVNYEDIKRLMRTGEGTIASVHRWLQRGNENYTRILPKLKKEMDRRMKEAGKRGNPHEYGSFEWLKRKYPLHFLIFNIMDSLGNKTSKGKKR